MEFRLQAIPVGTLLRTETRILATNPRTRRAFATYWFFIRAGSGAIRLSFRLALLGPTGAYWLDDPPNLSCRTAHASTPWTIRSCLVNS
jgi:hypothetical protein